MVALKFNIMIVLPGHVFIGVTFCLLPGYKQVTTLYLRLENIQYMTDIYCLISVLIMDINN